MSSVVSSVVSLLCLSMLLSSLYSPPFALFSVLAPELSKRRSSLKDSVDPPNNDLIFVIVSFQNFSKWFNAGRNATLLLVYESIDCDLYSLYLILIEMLLRPKQHIFRDLFSLIFSELIYGELSRLFCKNCLMILLLRQSFYCHQRW